jgi:RNA polymerase sigma factor (sigma-70 family)
LAVLVHEAGAGDVDALARLVRMFQDYAVACAIGYGVDPDEARDVAQEAFLSLPSQLPALRTPDAFPVWFRRLIRTHSLRHLRSQRHIDLQAEVPDRPAVETTARVSARAVDEALRHLTAAQRVVVALQYFGGLSQPEIAQFLAVPLSTVKKRAHDARAQLRKVLPVLEATARTGAPSRTTAFEHTIQLFAAIRRRDLHTLRRILADEPALVTARESWTVEDGLAAGLGTSGSATPLVRAATAGSPPLLDALLDAGADINAVCDCQTGESPLWAAVEVNDLDSVRLLLDRGADPNLAAALDVTPLMLAAMRGSEAISECLLVAGADSASTDARGRTAADWRRRPVPEQTPALHTGIKAIDLLIPLADGDLIAVESSYGLGLRVLLTELCLRLPGPATWIVDPSEQNPTDAVITGVRELGAAEGITIAPLPSDRTVDEQLAAATNVIRRTRPAVLVLLHGTTRSTALDALLPSLRNADVPRLAFVVGPTGPLPSRRGTGEIPDGFDGLLALDPRRARAGLWPAVDLTHTRRRVDTAPHVRRLAADYDRADPELSLPTPARTGPDGELAARARSLHRYLTQPFQTAEPHTARPAEWVAAVTLRREVANLLCAHSAAAID